jgi:hypothetical protein
MQDHFVEPNPAVGERQKVGGPVLTTVGRTARRTTRGINRLKGSVADLLQPCDTPTPDFLALSLIVLGSTIADVAARRSTAASVRLQTY